MGESIHQSNKTYTVHHTTQKFLCVKGTNIVYAFFHHFKFHSLGNQIHASNSGMKKPFTRKLFHSCHHINFLNYDFVWVLSILKMEAFEASSKINIKLLKRNVKKVLPVTQ